MFKYLFLTSMLVSLPSISSETELDYEQIVSKCNEAVEKYQLCKDETAIGARKQCLIDVKALIQKDCDLILKAGEMQKLKQSKNTE